MIKDYHKFKGVHPSLQILTHKVSDVINLKILDGLRTVEQQADLIKRGKSKLTDPKRGPHVLGHAIDVIPLDNENKFYGWGDDGNIKELAAFYSLQAIYRAVSVMLKIPIRVGSDWDMDWSFKDQGFDDLVHVELVNPTKENKVIYFKK